MKATTRSNDPAAKGRAAPDATATGRPRLAGGAEPVGEEVDAHDPRRGRRPPRPARRGRRPDRSRGRARRARRCGSGRPGRRSPRPPARPARRAGSGRPPIARPGRRRGSRRTPPAPCRSPSSLPSGPTPIGGGRPVACQAVLPGPTAVVSRSRAATAAALRGAGAADEGLAPSRDRSRPRFGPVAVVGWLGLHVVVGVGGALSPMVATAHAGVTILVAVVVPLRQRPPGAAGRGRGLRRRLRRVLADDRVARAVGAVEVPAGRGRPRPAGALRAPLAAGRRADRLPARAGAGHGDGDGRAGPRRRARGPVEHGDGPALLRRRRPRLPAPGGHPGGRLGHGVGGARAADLRPRGDDLLPRVEPRHRLRQRVELRGHRRLRTQPGVVRARA